MFGTSKVFTALPTLAAVVVLIGIPHREHWTPRHPGDWRRRPRGESASSWLRRLYPQQSPSGRAADNRHAGIAASPAGQIQSRVRNRMVKRPDASDLPSPITEPLETAATATSASGSSFFGSASSRIFTAPASDRGRVRGRLASLPTTIASSTTTPPTQITSFRLPLIFSSSPKFSSPKHLHTSNLTGHSTTPACRPDFLVSPSLSSRPLDSARCNHSCYPRSRSIVIPGHGSFKFDKWTIKRTTGGLVR